MSRSTVLVTGGAGFIGSELVRQLVADGERVVVIDNLVNGRRENLAGLSPAQVTLVEADIRHVPAVRPHLRDARIVYHLACLGVRHSVHSPIENHEVNATATLHLLQACRAADVPRFVCVSSSEVYGNEERRQVGPLTRADEPAPGDTAQTAPMTEDHPAFPCTVYGASKLAGECYARAFHRTYGYPAVVVRPFNAYGPRSHHEGDSGEVIPKFLLRSLAGKPMVIFGDGTQTRDFTFVSDTARGILLAGTADAAIGQTLNMGSGIETTINDLACAVAAVAGRETTVVHDEGRPGDVWRLCADTTRARTLLGFEPAVSLHEGLARLLDWYRSLGVSPEELLRDEIVRNWA